MEHRWHKFTESYFTITDNVLKRFFFITGLTKDRFCEDNLVYVDLNRLLYRHLKGIGYERIIFYSKDEKLYFYDRNSYNLTVRPNEGSAVKPKTAKPPLIKSNRLQGPIPGKLKPAAASPEQTHAPDPAETPAQDDDGKLHFGRMDENLAFERINYCIKSDRAKTAVVFSNADDFMRSFSGGGLGTHVFDSFAQYAGLGPDNTNIVLFIFPEGNQSDTAVKCKGTFFEEKMTKENTVIINPPALGEIRNVINYYRLMRGLAVDFICFDAVCKRTARELCKTRRQLQWLMVELKKTVEKSEILDSERSDKMIGKNETVMQKLYSLVGMESVKEEIRILKSRKKTDEKPAANEKHHSRILPPVLKDAVTYNLHYVITGNPGTGKTTAARLLGEIMYEAGYLESGHTVEVSYKELVSQYNSGDTAAKTNEAIERAMGGVLFIDEAYMLAPGKGDGSGGWGQIAIDTILKAMSDRNGQFSVVVAGYPDKMETFIGSNQGLTRRFLKTIHIDDYSAEELLQIFYNNLQNNAMRQKYIVSDTLSAVLAPFFENWHRSRDENWGNAGEVEKLLQSMDGNWYKRGGEKSAEDELILDVDDIPEDLRRHCRPAQESKEDAMKKLEKLTGLNRVKERIEELKRNIGFEEEEGGTEPGHYIFAGNPGTGKTTVARLLGDIFREEGVLRRGHVVEVAREDLVGEYVGQTAPKTKEALKQAIDGILFIDEAYSLVEGGKNDYGQEAVNTLVAFMENNRSRICVICAGYTKDMDRFVKSNAGLTSRFSEIIQFDDYTVEELIEILHGFGEGYEMEEDFIQRSREVFTLWIKNKGDDFGNARDVRNYFKECVTALRKRLVTEYGSIAGIPEKARKVLTGKDIPAKHI